MKTLLFILIIFYSNNYSQSKYDFVSDSLFIVWGKKNYTDKNDCSAKVSLNSDGENIHINIDVLDDILILNSGPINSDHIELWFSLPELAYDQDFSSSKFIISNSYLYLINGVPDLQKFKTFIKDPLIHSYDSDIDSFYYNQIKDSLRDDYGWLKESIDNYLRDAKSSKLYMKNFPLGIVHFGLLPNSNSAIQYDTSLYRPLMNFTKINFDNLTKYIKFSKEITPTGYKLHIIIKPKALGFVSKYGIDKLSFLVDIVDVDYYNKQETLLSTNKNRKWYEPSSFNRINIQNRIDVPISENIHSLGREISYKTPYDKITHLISDYFINSDKGWVPIDIQKPSFYKYNQPEVYVIEEISKIRIKKSVLEYNKKLLNKSLLENIKCSSGEFLILNKKQILDKKGIVKKIILPDSNIGFLFSDYEISGRYTKQIISYLYFITDQSKQLIASYLYGWPSSIRINCLNDKYLKLKQNYLKLDWDGWSDKNINWQNVIDYKSGNQFFTLSFDDSLKYKIKWDKNGKIINQP